MTASKPDPRRILRAQRLCAELGHTDILAALEHMQRMATALRVLQTWAAFPPLNVRDVREVCADALSKEAPR